MFANVSLTRIDDRGLPMSLLLQANAANNNLTTALSWDDNSVEKQMKGRLDAVTHLYRNLRNEAEAHVTITPSPIYLGGELWHVEASDMIYNPKGLDINSFTLSVDRTCCSLRQIVIEFQITSEYCQGQRIAGQAVPDDVGYFLTFIGIDAVGLSSECIQLAV